MPENKSGLNTLTREFMQYQQNSSVLRSVLFFLVVAIGLFMYLWPFNRFQPGILDSDVFFIWLVVMGAYLVIYALTELIIRVPLKRSFRARVMQVFESESVLHHLLEQNTANEPTHLLPKLPHHKSFAARVRSFVNTFPDWCRKVGVMPHPCGTCLFSWMLPAGCGLLFTGFTVLVAMTTPDAWMGFEAIAIPTIMLIAMLTMVMFTWHNLSRMIIMEVLIVRLTGQTARELTKD